MRIVRAKVLATGEEIVLAEKEGQAGVFFDCIDNREFKADELEILIDKGTPVGGMPPMPELEPLGNITMLKDMIDSMKNHFWRDQRVEIVKIMLSRENVCFSQVVETADEIVQKLKSYGD